MTTAAVRKKNPLRFHRRWHGVGVGGLASRGFLSLVILASLFPLYWAWLVASGDANTITNPDRSWVPGPNFISNATQVLESKAVNFWTALWNSTIISTVCAISVIAFATLAGYAFAKMKFAGRNWLLAFVLATTAVPMQLGVVPLFIVMTKLQWTGQLEAVIVPHLVTAFGVFWMTQYISQVLPDELLDAARVDGAGVLRTFWHVVLPAARPAAAMLGVFTFIQNWVQFFWPFIVLNRSNPTLPVALQTLQANYFVDYSIVIAGAILATIPLLILFLIAGRQLVHGIMAGAVKG